MFDKIRNSVRRRSQYGSKDTANGVNGSKSATNGTNGTNGKAAVTNGTNGTTNVHVSSAYTNGNVDGHAGSSASGQVEGAADGTSRYPIPAEEGHSIADVVKAVASLKDVVEHSMRELPTDTADGQYLKEEEHHSRWADLKTIGIKDLKTLKEQIAVGTGPVDDKTMLMERVIQLVADLPDKSPLRKDLTNTFVDTLYNSLQHPPQNYLGDDFKYRRADGSNNSILYPHIGAANMTYARTVAPETIQSGTLPDPGLVFDSLFARETFRPHPNKNSSIIFYWASLIIHDLFQTDHQDFSKSQTSSYLDLSPLYGDVQEDQDQIRTFKDGLLKPDCFAEHRLLTFPPGCGTLIIMFNRFHNYVATQLAQINENGRFTKPRDGLPEEAAKKAWKKYDNDLFQTARLVTSGLYMNITLIDYVRVIVNLNRSNTTWTLDPRVKMADTAFNDKHTPRGEGNQVSAEFSMVYRWHSAISERDDLWTQNLFKNMFGKPAEDISMPEMLMGLHKWEVEMPKDPFKRDFHGLKRGPDGKFNDDDLVEIMTSSIEDCAGAFGPNHVPKCMKAIEILGQKQARAWDMCSLNEFRKFFGLKTHRTFEDIHPDPAVAAQLKNLYEHPDRVELYAGLIAEQSKEPIPKSEGGPVGVGISPTYTISRAILSDAVALVRGDRFYTTDYHPKNLTNWGFTEVSHNFDIEQGCCFYKLFLRAFPLHFKPNSIYAHHPMTIPSENRNIMKDLGRETHYSWDRPVRQQERVMIQNYRGVRHVVEDKVKYNVMVADAFKYIMGPQGANFMLSGDSDFHAQQKKTMAKALYHDQWKRDIKNFYEYITMRLFKDKSVKIANINQVDITRDVGNLAHIHFAAGIFHLPLKTAENPHGVYSEQELYLVMSTIFIFLFFDIDPAKSFPLALITNKITKQLGALVTANVKLQNKIGFLNTIKEKLHDDHNGPLAQYGQHMVQRLLETGMSVEELVWSQIVPTAGAMVANQAQVFTQVVDFYMAGEGKKHWPEIRNLAHQDTDEADAKILKYVMEGMRLNGTFGGYRRAAADDVVNDEGFSGQASIKKGDKVFVSFVKASRDPTVFPNPNEVDLDRPLDDYLNYGNGPHTCLGKDASQIALTAMLKVTAKIPGLRVAPGPQGQLKKVDRGDGFYAYMTEDWGRFNPFPTTWKMHWDGDIPEPKFVSAAP